MPKSKKAQTKEEAILPLSEQLQRLQAPKNNGRGVACIRGVCSDLSFGDRKGAMMLVAHDWDKIANYPDIAKFLKDNQLADPDNYVHEA